MIYGKRNDRVDGDSFMAYFLRKHVDQVSWGGLAAAIYCHTRNREGSGAGSDVDDPAIIFHMFCRLLHGEVTALGVDREQAVELFFREIRYRYFHHFNACISYYDVDLPEGLF